MICLFRDLPIGDKFIFLCDINTAKDGSELDVFVYTKTGTYKCQSREWPKERDTDEFGVVMRVVV